jgi:uncharacterized protein (DUF1684 family)
MNTLMDMSPDEYVAAIATFRRQKDDYMATSPDSPLPGELGSIAFDGLRYYPADLTYRVAADLAVFDGPRVIRLGATGGDLRPQLRYAQLSFTIMGEQCHLLAFKDADDPDSTELFIPFKDATSGGETYGAGRYLDAQDAPDESSPRKVVLDFNLAYSPYCAYNSAYSCPLPPAENVLQLPILAGELLLPIHH